MSLERIRVESQQELEQMVTNELNQIEKDLTVICSNVPIKDKATLDILCHDESGQLVILQLGVKEDDIMFLHGIQSIDYVDKFKSFLKATYNKHKIDDKEMPRLILIAPSFSDALRRAVEGMKGISVDLYEWEYLKLGDHEGLHLQPIFTSKPMEKLKEEKPAEKKREPKTAKKKEPEPTPSPELPQEPHEPTPTPPMEEPKEEHVEPKRKLKLF